MYRVALAIYLLLVFDASAQSGARFQVQFLKEFRYDDSSKEPFASPQALSVDAQGNIFVLDTGNNRVVKLDSMGEFLTSVGGFGWEREQFDLPVDICSKSLLDVFIADQNNERIERYDNNLNFISSFTYSNNASPDLQLRFPGGVDFSKHGELFLSDTENNRILKLDSFGEPVSSFGDFNWGEGRIHTAGKIELGDNDVVFVADLGPGDIIVFDYFGNFITRFGDEDLEHPLGMFWTQKFFYVVDAAKHCVVMFDQLFGRVFKWGSHGSKYGAFDMPADVAVIGERVFVLDSNNQRIQIFKIAEY